MVHLTFQLLLHNATHVSCTWAQLSATYLLNVNAFGLRSLGRAPGLHVARSVMRSGTTWIMSRPKSDFLKRTKRVNLETLFNALFVRICCALCRMPGCAGFQGPAIAMASHNVVLVQLMNGLFQLVFSTVKENRRAMFEFDNAREVVLLWLQPQR